MPVLLVIVAVCVFQFYSVNRSVFSIICNSTVLGETMLHCACIRGDLKAVISLVEGGADVHALDNASQWWCSWALCSLVHTVAVVVDSHEHMWFCHYSDWTPLHEAANHGRVDIVNFLLEHGADVHAPGHDKTTPLLDAVYGGHYEVRHVSHGGSLIAAILCTSVVCSTELGR